LCVSGGPRVNASGSAVAHGGTEDRFMDERGTGTTVPFRRRGMKDTIDTATLRGS